MVSKMHHKRDIPEINVDAIRLDFPVKKFRTPPKTRAVPSYHNIKDEIASVL